MVGSSDCDARLRGLQARGSCVEDLEDLGDLACAGAATVEEFSVDSGLYNLIFLHDLPNSHGWVADAATDLHENLLDGVFSLHALGGHGGAASVLGDTGSVAFSRTDSLIHGSLANSSFHPIHACAHSCFDGCRAGFGVCGWGCARAPVSFLSDVPDVPDDEDDACMDGVNSVIQGFGSHATACSSLDALHNSRWARGHCLRGGTKCTSTGSRDQVWLSDESKEYFSHQEPESLHVEAWADAQCLSHKGSQVQGLRLGVLQCPFPLVFLISLLCYLGQVVKLESDWVGHSWRKLAGLGCGFSGVPIKGRIFFLPLPFLETGLKRGRTTQRGRFLGIPCARAHMRMGMAQLSGHTRGSSVGNCSRGCGGLSLP